MGSMIMHLMCGASYTILIQLSTPFTAYYVGSAHPSNTAAREANYLGSGLSYLQQAQSMFLFDFGILVPVLHVAAERLTTIDPRMILTSRPYPNRFSTKL